MRQLKTRTLAGKALFPIGLGAMPLSLAGRPPEKEALQILLRFFELGGNFIDTADVYGLDDKERGHNERLIQKALAAYGKPDSILIASKGGASRPQGGWALGGGQPQQLRQACEASLQNLKCEAHSLYYLHGPDKQVPLEDSLGELIRLKEEGKIHHLGIANVNLQQLQQALKLTPLVAVQNRCNPFCKEDLKNSLIDFCQTHNLTYVPYCPLGGWADHAHLAKNPVYRDLGAKYQCSPYSLSLAWLLTKGAQLIPIPGMDKLEQVAENLASVALELEEEDLQTLDDLPNLYAARHIDP